MDAPLNLSPPQRARTPEPRENEYRRSIGRPLKRLSSSATIQREAEMEAFLTFEGRPISPSRELDKDTLLDRDRSLSVSPKAIIIDTSSATSPPKSPQTRFSSRPKVALEQYEVFRAIDKKDLDLLGEFRDRAFHFLLERQVGGQTPMVYAMQRGLPYQEVVLFLVGAISQWINRLNDSDFSRPETAKLLKLARANLKFAIDEGLSKLRTGLIASFLQTLVMCEGDRWIRDQITTLSYALRAGAAGKPVEVAGAAV
ncbi:Gluconolactonase, partial [Termitomyces sp. T112]